MIATNKKLTGSSNSSSGFRSVDIFEWVNQSETADSLPCRNIESHFTKALTDFEMAWMEAHSILEMARATAKFVFDYLEIHPFSASNSTTLREFLQEKFQHRELYLWNFQAIELAHHGLIARGCGYEKLVPTVLRCIYSLKACRF